MIHSLVHWFVSGLALLATSYIVPGFQVKNFSSALVAAVLIGFANIVIRPILLFLAFPMNILTLGLFTFVIDGIILKTCATFMKDFNISSWFSSILGAFILTIVSTLLHFFLV